MSAPASVLNSPVVGTNLACWCGAAPWLLQFRTPRFGLLRCASCGGYRIDPPPLQHESQSETFYTEYYSSLEVPASGSWFQKVAVHVPELAGAGKTAADIGCGDGHLCAELHGRGWQRVIGIEVSRTRVARARRRYPEIEFYDGPLDSTGVAKQSLDLVVMDSVIEHLLNPVGVLREIAEYLKPSGRILLLTPNLESGHFRFLGRRWTGMLAPHAHIFLFTRSSIARLLQISGFQVTHTGSLHAPLYTAGEWLRRLFSGDVKGAVWRAHQEVGALYGRLIGSGPMLYAVAQPLAR